MSGRLSLLFVTPWFLFPADSGGKIRTRDVLRGMKGGAFDITLVSPDAPARGEFSGELDRVCDRFVGWEAAADSILRPFLRACHLLSAVPVSVATDRSEKAKAVVADQLKNDFDLVVLDFPHAAEFMPRAPHVPTVIFTHNVESEIYKRHAGLAAAPMNFVWKNQYRKMLRYEKSVLLSCNSVIAVSQRDKEFFQTAFEHKHVSEIPTGVDLEEFSYKPPASLSSDKERASLVFVGSMNWRANIDAIEFFMNDVWPVLCADRNDISMTVVGHSPPQSLVGKAKEKNLPWEFTGFVDDLRPYVYKSAAFIMPIRIGGGTRIKSYQGMALGCPVVSTGIGVEGLPLESGEHYLLADSATEFADAVARLVDNEDLRNRLSTTAYEFVRRNFSAGRVSKEFEKICVETVERAAAGGGPAARQ